MEHGSVVRENPSDWLGGPMTFRRLGSVCMGKDVKEVDTRCDDDLL